MYIDRTKLKKANTEDLSFGQTLYEDKNGLITYQVDRTYNKIVHDKSIPLIVVNDINGYFKKNMLVYRDINNLLYI